MQSIKIKSMLRYLTMIFTLIPVLIVAIIGFFSMTGFAQSTIEQYARHIGFAQSSAIDQVIGQYDRDVKYLGCSNAMDTFANTGGSTSIAEDLPKLFDSIIERNENDVLNIVVLSKDGTVIYDHKNMQKQAEFFFGYEEMNDTFSVGQTYVSSICGAGTYCDSEVFFVVRHIADPIINAASGYIVEVVSTSRITAIAQNSTFGEGKGYIALSDGKDTILNYNGNASLKIDSIGDNALKDIFRSSQKNTEGGIDYAAGGFIGNYGSFTDISSSGWKWVTIYPGGMAMSQILVPTIIAIAVLLVLAVLCIFLGQFVTNSITNPINTIIRDMRDIQEGDREKRIELNCKNEFKEISVLFNGMLDEVSLSEELHRTISNISDNMLFEWDFHKERMYLSPNFTEKFDIDPAVAQLANGKFLDKLMSEDYSDTYKRDISTLLKNKTGHSSEYQILTKNGTIVWFGVRAQCITDRLGEPLRVVGVVTDIDNEKKLELQLSERASYDFLSQLYNRSTFEKELQSEIERNAHTKVGVLFIDVDDFKFINDRFGHSVGDEVIKYVSGCIKQRVKGSGFAGRFGGDEFVLCITDQQQIAEIESLSLDLIDELYAGYRSELANVFINVKASIGIAFSPEHGEAGSQVIAAADEAMYFVKKNGKANYHIYQPEDSQMEDLQHTL